MSTAQAQSPDKPPADAATTVSAPARLGNGARVDSDSAAAQVERFWTPQRMRDAIPLQIPDPPAAQSREAAAPGARAGSIPPAAPAASSPAARAGLTENLTVGKVYFTKPSDGLQYQCSASAINSPSRQMVITAGHCVHEGKGGQWVRDWEFVPRYRSGKRPFGTFAATAFITFNGWVNDSNFNWDVGMVTTRPLNGRKLVDVTGGQGLSWNYSRKQNVTIFGYPSNHDDGEIQWSCDGRTHDSSRRLGIKCNFGKGSSGGPWLRQYNSSTGLGYVNGVMSTIFKNGRNESSYFGNGVKKLYDEQGSVT
ncbi:hypothetical protein [Streptomyces luteireticuli]|uniref:trypsin-like serine peptidase n=1 Tax=Streptomyces luteireticuli TaxID=173858 RepID=UPI0031CE3906